MVLVKKALVVDDDALVRSTVERHLTRLGYQTRTARHTMEAVHLIEREAYDLVVTDQGARRLKGSDLIRVVRRTCAGTVAILMTGDLLDPEESRQAHGVLRKPFLAEDLRRLVDPLARPGSPGP